MRESQPRILLVDDDSAVLAALTVLFEASGFACLAASDGFEALKVLRLGVPEIMISDLRMPRMSGYELLPIVKRRYPQVKLVVMSAEDVESVRPLGLPMDAYLQKGGNATHLLLTLVRDLLSAPPVSSEGVEEQGEKSPT